MPRQATRDRWRSALASRRGTAGLALLLYVAVVIYLTWPLAIDLNSRIYAVEPGDPMGLIALLRALVDGPHNPFVPGRLDEFSFPSGMPIDWSVNVAAFPSTALLFVLALSFGPIAAWGLFTLLGFVASATAMYLLLRKYTGDPWLALIFGFSFAYFPFTILTAHSAHLIHGWTFVLLVWRMLRLSEEPTLRNGLLAGAATVLVLSWTPYFILLGGVCYATFLIVDLLSAAARRTARDHLKAQLVGGATILVYLGVLQALWHLARPLTLPPNADETVITQFSARPIEYLLPPAENPIFGDRTGPLIADHVMPDARVYPLYVGLVALALALWAIVIGLRRRNRMVLAFAAVGVAATVFSMPPHMDVLGVSVPFPSGRLSELVPSWRIYSRFVVLVMLAVSVLAALGASFAKERAPRRLRPLFLAVLAVAVPLDLWVTPPVRTTKIDTPPIYSVARGLPPGALAEYPLRPAELSGNYSHLFFQHAHGKPILNGYLPRSKAEERALQMSRLDDLSTPNMLADLGIKYVLLRHDRELGMIEPGRPVKDFRLIADTPYAALYRVHSSPARGTIFPLTGFYLPEGQAPGVFRWIVDDEAKLLVKAPCSPCQGTLEFRSASFGRGRVLAVFGERGRLLALQSIDAQQPELVRVPLRFSRQTVLRLRTNPPPEPVGGTDFRRVSISFVQPARFVRKR